MADKGYDVQTWADYDGEHSAVRMRTAAITAANFDAQAVLRASLHVATAGIVVGVLNKNAYGNEDIVSLDKASDDAAQRELKWLVGYHDATTLKRGSYEIPTADTDQLDPNDRAHAHIGDADVVDAYITAAEAFFKTGDGNAIVIDEITLVGRRV